MHTYWVCLFYRLFVTFNGGHRALKYNRSSTFGMCQENLKDAKQRQSKASLPLYPGSLSFANVYIDVSGHPKKVTTLDYPSAYLHPSYLVGSTHCSKSKLELTRS